MARKTLEASVTDFIQAIGLMVRKVRAAASGPELSLTESAVLGRLEREGPGTIAELARAESVRPQSMGSTVAALEERGLVTRTPHATDGRQVNIQLTAQGAGVRKSMGDAKRNWLAQEIARLPDEDRQTLFRAGEIIRRIVD
jgi:DNA-binding MarR family transcriptional regulator